MRVGFRYREPQPGRTFDAGVEGMSGLQWAMTPKHLLITLVILLVAFATRNLWSKR